jgi:hypothetical protein
MGRSPTAVGVAPGKVRTMGVDERPEHERHPEGGRGADLGHLHEAIEEEGGEGPGLGGTAASPRPSGSGTPPAR